MRQTTRHLFQSLSMIAFCALLPAAQAFELPKVGLPKLFGDESSDGQPTTPGATPDCPDIFLDPGASMIRVPAEADSAGVRYQLSIRQSARECVLAGESLTIKVGVEGGAMLGPLGSSGAYGGNIRVAIREVKNDAVVASKTYRVNATIPSGASRADFQLVADPIVVPVISPKPQDDYEIMIGFSQGAADADSGAKSAQKTGKKKRRSH